MPERSSDRRVYHFLPEVWALDDLQRRRLKIAEIDKLNDPFEFLGPRLDDRAARQAFQAMKTQLTKTRGIICFSRNWSNPVQWSHYADHHRGICLGFDVPAAELGRVRYSPTRITLDLEALREPNSISVRNARGLLLTKFEHWRYEQEERLFLEINTRDPDNGHFFVDFAPYLTLREVILGAENPTSEDDLMAALGDYSVTVRVMRARLAFKAFKVTAQKDGRHLWRS